MEEKEILEEEKVNEEPKEENQPEEKVEEKVEPKEDTPVEKKEEPEESSKEEEKVAPETYSDENLGKIEEHRKELFAVYKKQNLWKWVFSLISISILVFAFIGVPNILPGEDQNTLRLTLMIVLAAISLLMMFSYSFFLRRALNKKVRTYFDNVYTCLNAYHFDSPNVSVDTVEVSKALSKVQFDEAHLYKNVLQVNSRNLVEVKYKNINVLIADAAGQINDGKRLRPIFVGKFIEAPFAYKDDPIIVYAKGDKRSIAPTETDDMKLVYDDEKMAVYSNNSDWNKIVNAKFKEHLFKIKLDKTLIDIAISIRDGKVFFCLGYDDDLMILPLEKKFLERPNVEFKEDLYNVFDFIEYLNK